MSTMRSTSASQLGERDFARVAAAVRFLSERLERPPTLAEVAAHVGLSPFHFNRLFRRWAGITPKQFLGVLRAQAAVGALRRGESVLEAALGAGMSGPGRLHDLLVTLEAATPGEIRRRGHGLEIRWGRCDSPFGTLTAAETPRGFCHLSFGDDERQEAPAALREIWARARLLRDDAVAARVVALLEPPGASRRRTPLALHVAGTNFQLRVWRALLELGRDETTTYGGLARALRVPGAARAVGGAVGANPVGWLIPCHRVLRENGALGGYRWGEDRKRAMLAWEALRCGPAARATARA
jgi:AraC family transcriptional regulator of adaptative response/methylated-DNA-[protein]-cysteine methyltransferase